MADKITNEENIRYLSDHEDFQGFIKVVASKNNMKTGVIEKDYWVTRILRELVCSDFKDAIVFKGGTCLSKAWNIIDRFSEDIDLLLIPIGLTSKSQQKRYLKNLRDFISAMPDFTYIDDGSITSAHNAKYYFSYKKNTQNELPSAINPNILLEPGYRGGTSPHITNKEINSILADYILKQGHSDIADDLQPFLIQCLSIDRIFIEKLDAIRSLFEVDKLKLRTRHYYDLYKLLDHERIQNLPNTLDIISLILDDISSISQEHFGLTRKITISDIKSCPAFDPNYAGLTEIEKGYKNDKALYFAKQPDFKEIINEISEFIRTL